jgi:hypothetical protein
LLAISVPVFMAIMSRTSITPKSRIGPVERTCS